jgi:hypothetical protein
MNYRTYKEWSARPIVKCKFRGFLASVDANRRGAMCCSRHLLAELIVSSRNRLKALEGLPIDVKYAESRKKWEALRLKNYKDVFSEKFGEEFLYELGKSNGQWRDLY